eukprot:scaffold72584_cov75-Phaeocystis_antarctica.AAC.8
MGDFLEAARTQAPEAGGWVPSPCGPVSPLLERRVHEREVGHTQELVVSERRKGVERLRHAERHAVPDGAGGRVLRPLLVVASAKVGSRVGEAPQARQRRVAQWAERRAASAHARARRQDRAVHVVRVHQGR